MYKNHLLQMNTLICILLLSVYNKEIFDNYFLLSGIIILFGNFLIGLLIKKFHTKGQTDEYPSQDWFQTFIKNLSGLLEMGLFSFLLSLQQTTLLAGFLILRSMGTSFVDSKIGEENAKKEGIAVNILRVGVILSFIVSFIAAFFLVQSNLISELKKTKIIRINTSSDGNHYQSSISQQ